MQYMLLAYVDHDSFLKLTPEEQKRGYGAYQAFVEALKTANGYRRTGEANWTSVVRIYDALWALSGSPVVALNRALAVAEADGAAAGLRLLESLQADARLTEYQPYWAARAELLVRTGAHVSAREAYEVAIGLERDPAVRSFLQQRQSALADSSLEPVANRGW